MKILTSLSLGLAMGLVTLPATAVSDRNEQLALCNSQLQAIYGPEVRVKLRSIGSGRRVPMKLQVSGEQLERTTVHCARGADGGVELTDRDGLALTAPDPAQNRVSVID